MKRTSGRIEVIATSAVLLFAAAISLYSQDVKISPTLLTKKNPVPASSASLAKAKANFEDNCTPCHGNEGKGDGPLAESLGARFGKTPKDLTSAKTLSELTDGEIFWTITKGRNPMPAFDQKLTDEERWGLVLLLRNISHTRPNITPHHQ